MRKIKLSLLISIIMFAIINIAKSQVVINEYSCANLKSYTDNFGKYEDWIELYNTTSSTVDLTDYYISDRTSKPMKWKIPVSAGTTIPANGFMIIFASNRDTAISGFFHTNFALKQTKQPTEQIVLSNPAGMIIDTVNISALQLGHSYGRVTNGASTWGVFSTPTPKTSNNAQQVKRYAVKPVFSLIPGFYNNTINVSISTTEPNSTIRYTLNGDEPTASSIVYSTSIPISSTKVLKAKVFSTQANVLPSLYEYGTYFINVNHTLEVVSVSGTQLTTLLNGNGTLRPYGSIEYFGKDKLLKENSTGEFNQHGKDSWICDQKAIDFIARDEMGDDYALRVNYVSSTPRDEYQRVLLRASGDDNYPCGNNSSNEGSAHMRDGYIHNLAKKGNLHLDVRACERVVMYVNGEYWGVYEIRENPDDHDYTKYYYNQDKYNIQYIMTWAGTWVEYGDETQTLNEWQYLYNYIMNNDMSEPANYAYVESKYNVKSLVDYVLVNSITVCTDWLNYNTGWWRGLNPKGDHKKWGYILWDNDATFDFYINYSGVPDHSATAQPCNPDNYTPYDDPEGHLKILSKLNTNPDFHQYYVNRQTDLLNTTFSCDSMLNYLDYYVSIIQPEMAQHATRWFGTYNGWNANVQTLRNFIQSRCTYLETGIKDCYNLTGPFDLTVTADSANAGSVKVNSVVINTLPWKGRYYGGINTTLTVKSYDTLVNVFDYWSATHHTFIPDSNSSSIIFSLTQADTIIAHFQQINNINENQINKYSVNVFPTAITSFVNVDFTIPEPTEINIELINLSGQKVAQLIPFTKFNSSGHYNLKLDLSKSNLKNEIYLLKFNSKKFTNSYKIVYLNN